MEFGVLDVIVFGAALVLAMAVGYIAGRKEETSEDYFLAGKSIPWWGVAGSIFGSNVSANHMVGMMGVGMTIGFAQSHFEIGAIAGLVLLCYGFLPVYRKLNVFTLSEYLEHRYDHRSRLSYALIMVIIMAVIQLSPALYIGARSMCQLAGSFAMETPSTNVADPGAADSAGAEAPVKVKFFWYAAFVMALATVSASYTVLGGLKAVIWTDFIQSILLLAAGLVVAILVFYQVGGWNGVMKRDQAAEQTLQAEQAKAADAGDSVDPKKYPGRKMGLYRPMSHPALPWTGVLTGLMIMHCFYWGTNQFIVQRALGARSDREARLGIIAAGFLKLSIPFFAIAGGVAAYYMFLDAQMNVAQDTAFIQAVLMVIPAKVGLTGLIAAGLIGAILSSIDSMMNSAATIITIDIYRRYFRPEASDREMILVGRISIVAFVLLAAGLAILVLDPNSESNFFLSIANYQNYFTPGLLVAFGLGMLWRRGTPTAGFAAIVAGIVLSFAVEKAYDVYIGVDPVTYQMVHGTKQLSDFSEKELPSPLKNMTAAEQQDYLNLQRENLNAPRSLIISKQHLIDNYLGLRLNFFHRMVIVIGLCVLIYVVVSLLTPYDAEKGRMVWTDLGGHQPSLLKLIFAAFALSLIVYAAVGWAMAAETITPLVAGLVGGGWTFALFAGAIVWTMRTPPTSSAKADAVASPGVAFFGDDRFWAGVLCATAVFMLYYFR